MQMPTGAEVFSFPNPQPSSPPTTPSSSNSKQSSNTSQPSQLFNKRYGYIRLDYSPPENIEPKGLGYQFSYTPPQRNLSSGSLTSESDEIDESDGEESEDEVAAPEVESQSATSEPARRPSAHVRPVDEDQDFTVEEVSDDDIGYDDAEVVYPDHFEDAESERGKVRSAEVNNDLAERLREFQCADNAQSKEFDIVQHTRYLRKKKRWSKGGSHKRSHAESVGSDSEDDEDIEPLDVQQVGSSARRLRRRTQGPEERPRTSLLFDDPPKEVEELNYLDGRALETSSIGSDNDDAEFPSDGEDVADVRVTEVQDEEFTIPSWLYPMDVESGPSRPASALGSTAARGAER